MQGIKYVLPATIRPISTRLLEESLVLIGQLRIKLVASIEHFKAQRPSIRQFVLDYVLGLSELAEFEDLQGEEDQIERLVISPKEQQIVSKMNKQVQKGRTSLKRVTKRALRKLLLPLFGFFEESNDNARIASKYQGNITKRAENRFKQRWSP